MLTQSVSIPSFKHHSQFRQAVTFSGSPIIEPSPNPPKSILFGKSIFLPIQKKAVPSNAEPLLSPELLPKLQALNNEYQYVLNPVLKGTSTISATALYQPVAEYLGIPLQKTDEGIKLNNRLPETLVSGKAFFPQSIRARVEAALKIYDPINPNLNLRNTEYLTHYGLAAECSDVMYYTLRYLGTILKFSDMTILNNFYERTLPNFKAIKTQQDFTKTFKSSYTTAKKIVEKQSNSPAFEKIVDFCMMLDDTEYNAFIRNDHNGVISYNRDLPLRKQYREELIAFYTLNMVNYAVRKYSGMPQHYDVKFIPKIIKNLIDETDEMIKVNPAFELVKNSAETIGARYANPDKAPEKALWIELGDLIYALKIGYKHTTQSPLLVRDALNFSHQKSLARTELILYAQQFLCGKGKPFPGPTNSPENWLRLKKIAYAWEVPLELLRFNWHYVSKNQVF